MGDFLKKYFLHIILLATFFSFFFLLFNGNSHSNLEKNSVKGIDQILDDILPEDALKLLDERDDVVLIDVRTVEEFENERIPNSVREDRFENLDRDFAYILYCRTGNRSGKALNRMGGLGFTEVYNLEGGIEMWKENDFEVIY